MFDSLFNLDPISPIDREHPLTRGLVSMWKPLPTDGGVVLRDLCGVNPATLVNGAAIAASGERLGLSFDGVNDYALIGSSPTVAAGSPHTMSAFVFIRAFTQPYPLVMKLAGSGVRSHLMAVANVSPYLGILTGSATDWARLHSDTPANTFIASWNYIVVSYNGGTTSNGGSFRAFLNGVEISLIPAGAFAPSTNTGSFGVDIGNESVTWLDGNIDDVRFYNRALSADEIALIYEDSLTQRYEILRRFSSNAFWSVASSVGPTSLPWIYARRQSQIIGGGIA